MSSHKTAEEVRDSHVKAMGEALGTLYHALWNETAWLYMKWDEYVELFGTKPSRIDLLNESAGLFFRIIQDSLWEDLLIHIARLTDPPKSAGKDNLTIRRLPALIEKKELRGKVAKLIDTAIERADFCRDWRNRSIAHKDLKLATRKGAEPLKGASRAKLKEALSAISDVLNAVSVHYMDSTIMFEGVGSVNGAVSLLYVLDAGLQAKRERLHWLKTGNYQISDFRPRDL
jgi:hypothetical protein